MDTLVSVVIATHNRSNLLVRALNSVLNQTYSNIEVVVVSDGSTDDTKNVVQNMEKQDDRVSYFEYFPAQGGNRARNEGVQRSKGKYIAFLDDDDEWLPRKLQEQMNLIEADSNIGLVYTGVNIIYVNENVSYTSVVDKAGDLKKEILLGNCIGTTSSVLVKKNIIDQTGGFDENLPALQDFDLWIRICQITKVGVVAKPLINYFNYTGTVQVSAVTQKYVDAIKYIDDKYSGLFSKLTTAQIYTKKMNECTLLVNKCLRNGASRQARKIICKSYRNGFSKKMCALFLMSFFPYKWILKLRSLK